MLQFRTIFPGAQGGFAGFMVALIAALWAYDGWNDLTMVAGEVKQPQRNLPIALVAGVGIVGVLYMLTNAAIQYILPAAAIAASPRPALAALSVVAGSWGAGVVSIGMALSIVVTLNGTTMSGARVPFAAARDGLFFARMAHIHPRFQSPSTSLVVQAWLSTLLLLLVGRFQELFELAIFARVAFLYAHDKHDLCLSPAHSGSEPPLPRLGISGAAGSLHSGRGHSALLFLHRQSAEFSHRERHHPRRPSYSSPSSADEMSSSPRPEYRSASRSYTGSRAEIA